MSSPSQCPHLSLVPSCLSRCCLLSADPILRKPNPLSVRLGQCRQAPYTPSSEPQHFGFSISEKNCIVIILKDARYALYILLPLMFLHTPERRKHKENHFTSQRRNLRFTSMHFSHNRSVSDRKSTAQRSQEHCSRLSSPTLPS